MKTRKLIKDIERFLEGEGTEQFEARELENTPLGDAFDLLIRALKVLIANDRADENLKRHSKGLKAIIDNTITE